MAACGVASLVLGAATGWYSLRFFKAWGMALVSAWGGIIIGLVLAKAFDIHNGTACLLIALVSGILGAWLGRTMSRFLRSAGTAFVGSFLVIRGVGCYAGHYPGAAGPGAVETPELAAVWAYLAGLVFLTVAGTWV